MSYFLPSDFATLILELDCCNSRKKKRRKKTQYYRLFACSYMNECYVRKTLNKTSRDLIISFLHE